MILGHLVVGLLSGVAFSVVASLCLHSIWAALGFYALGLLLGVLASAALAALQPPQADQRAPIGSKLLFLLHLTWS